ncbi:MAG: hypothetical protein KBG11_01515 [Bacteroidia bacterium]|nr:hypothetical protein [Bacteroidia bacterium]
MKINILPYLLLAGFTFVAVFTSCKKDEDKGPSNASPNINDTTIVGKWMVIKAERKDSGETTYKNLTSTISACRLDDIEIFTDRFDVRAPNGYAYYKVNGQTKCSFEEDSLFYGHYILDGKYFASFGTFGLSGTSSNPEVLEGLPREIESISSTGMVLITADYDDNQNRITYRRVN